MKRYIKTKHHIYERFPKEGYIMNEEGGGVTDGSPELNPFDEEIVKESDTIEELCDGYIIEHPINAFKFFYDKEEMKKCLFNTCMRMFDIYDLKVFGCIKTDKGLIYVAKMNDEGRLELL